MDLGRPSLEVAEALRATLVSFDRPRAAAGVNPPRLWIAELGSFEAWAGPRGWELCFGKGSRCLVDPEHPGATTCAEIIVARRLAAAGYRAGWLNTYGSRAPAHWRPRFDPVDYQDAAIPPGISLHTAGAPDVFGFHDDRLAFIEVKRHPDRLSLEQARWFDNAIACGVPSSSLVVATWTGLR
jgi:hypothetical protein